MERYPQSLLEHIAQQNRKPAWHCAIEERLKMAAGTRATMDITSHRTADYIGSIIGCPEEVIKNQPRHDPHENTGG